MISDTFRFTPAKEVICVGALVGADVGDNVGVVVGYVAGFSCEV